MKPLRYCRYAALLLLLAGCATTPPAPVYEASKDLWVEEKPELKVRRPQTHIIREGETLVEIALKYGLDYQELAQWNRISNPDAIYTGDTIRLSSPGAPAAVTSAVASQKQVPLNSARIAKPGATLPSIVPTPKAGDIAISAITPVIPTPAPDPNAAANTTVARGNAPIKNGPVAEKYAYNKKTFNKLRSAHAAANAPSATTPQIAIAVAPSAAAAAPKQTRRRFNVDWSWPTQGAITRKFGAASKGIDIAGTKGAPIYAAADGKVVYTGSGIKSYGRLVILKHGNDYLSAYAHNDKILAKEGQTVARGEQIATLGDSGATQVMLHLEIRKSGKPFDPLQVLPPKQ